MRKLWAIILILSLLTVSFTSTAYAGIVSDSTPETWINILDIQYYIYERLGYAPDMKINISIYNSGLYLIMANHKEIHLEQLISYEDKLYVLKEELDNYLNTGEYSYSWAPIDDETFYGTVDNDGYYFDGLDDRFVYSKENEEHYVLYGTFGLKLNESQFYYDEGYLMVSGFAMAELYYHYEQSLNRDVK